MKLNCQLLYLNCQLLLLLFKMSLLSKSIFEETFKNIELFLIITCHFFTSILKYEKHDLPDAKKKTENNLKNRNRLSWTNFYVYSLLTTACGWKWRSTFSQSVSGCRSGTVGVLYKQDKKRRGERRGEETGLNNHSSRRITLLCNPQPPDVWLN